MVCDRKSSQPWSTYGKCLGAVGRTRETSKYTSTQNAKMGSKGSQFQKETPSQEESNNAKTRDCNLGANLVDFVWVFDDEIQISLLKISSLKFAPCLTAMLNKPLLKGPVLVQLYDLRFVPCVVSQNNSALQHDRNEHTVSLGSGWMYIRTYRHINAKIYREREYCIQVEINTVEQMVVVQNSFPQKRSFLAKNKQILQRTFEKNFRHTLSWIMCGPNMWKKQTRKQDLWQGDTSRCLLQQLGPFSDRLLFAPVTARTGLSSETTKKTPQNWFSDAHPSLDGWNLGKPVELGSIFPIV